jgi:hypothetical protein
VRSWKAIVAITEKSGKKVNGRKESRAEEKIYRTRMVKLFIMQKAGIQAPRAPIGFLPSLWRGVEAVNSHPGLLLIPLLLDAWLWFGPRLSIQAGVTPSLRALESAAASFQVDPALLKSLEGFFAGFNLFNLLSFLPLFPPSIMAARESSGTPVGAPIGLQIADPAVCIISAAGLVILSLCLGSMYWVAAGSAASEQRWTLREMADRWARTAGIVIATVFLFGMAFAVSFFAVSSLSQFIILFWPAGAVMVVQLFLFAAGGIFFWLILFMVFTPHGAVAFQDGLLRAMWNSVETARWIYPLSMWFPILLIILNVVATSIWSLPDPASWINMISLLGNAYTGSVLATASFAYYLDKRRWIGEVRALMQSRQLADIPPTSNP